MSNLSVEEVHCRSIILPLLSDPVLPWSPVFIQKLDSARHVCHIELSKSAPRERMDGEGTH